MLNTGRIQQNDKIFVEASKIDGVAVFVGDISQVLHFIVSGQGADDVTEGGIELEWQV